MADGMYSNVYGYGSALERVDPGDKAFVEAARNHIDQEILKLESDIRNLKVRRNTLALTSILPTEILAKIFLAYASRCSTNNPVEWVQVTHVSRYWRAVALNSPNLWTNIPFTRPSWAREMLQRSKSAPIYIRADVTYGFPKIKDIIEMALLNPARIRELDISCSSSSLRTIFENPPSSAPLLQTLSLSVNGDGFHGFFPEESFVLSDRFLSDDTSSLRHLELARCGITWNSSLLSNLTCLKIMKVATLPSTSELMDVLERSLNLEMLYLDNSLPDVGVALQVVSRNQVVNLPHLTGFSLVGTVPDCHNLLSQLSIPATANTYLDCCGTGVTNDDFSSIISALNQSQSIISPSENAGSPCPIRSLEVSETSFMSLWLRACSTVVSPSCAPFTSHPLHLKLSWHKAPTTKESTLAKVCNMLSLGQLVKLEISREIDTKTWISTFAHLPLLRDIEISNHPATNFVDALCRDPAYYPPTNSGRKNGKKGKKGKKSTKPATTKHEASRTQPNTRTAVEYFPSLSSITFLSAGFDEDIPGAERVVDKLVNCLIYRYEFNAEILKLEIEDGHYIYQKDIEKLREVVVDVDWDEMEQTYSDEDDEDEDEDNYSEDFYGEFDSQYGDYYDDDFY